ncbi:hypothetical protein AgCh_020090 [Apium graveolens]
METGKWDWVCKHFFWEDELTLFSAGSSDAGSSGKVTDGDGSSGKVTDGDVPSSTPPSTPCGSSTSTITKEIRIKTLAMAL